MNTPVQIPLNLLAVIYILCIQPLSINSRTSTLWRLNADKTKIIGDSGTEEIVHSKLLPHIDSLFTIITSTEHNGISWVKQETNYCPKYHSNKQGKNNTNANLILYQNKAEELSKNDLYCGKPVNFTFYDNLVGVINRVKHPSVVEPGAIFEFVKKFKFKNIKSFDLGMLEKRLKQIKKEKPKSVQLYIYFGNYWRIKGEPCQAIECFRKGLAISPHNPEILLNLAKVLFHLQYLDDAIYLTRRSLEVSPLEKSAWEQYFTLGEIFKAYGHYQEAIIHLRHTLDLNPGFEPAQKLLKEMENMPATPIHVYTLVIIICLVLGVLLVIVSSLDNLSSCNEEMSKEKHFNKAMAMRSLRGFAWSSKRSKKSM
ncbi:uncharacterized protein LOC132703447 [Cylas formicarius]|uniref:uncharacterized protein LOC132703447 n=1 Tax=Cylas formicarius TaxID=197179 RepID=UPI002958B733|nr:uncharacterized protein LOC132703447 [Cylas formicarius]